MEYLSTKIGGRYVAWLEKTNRYLLMEEPAFRVMILYQGGVNMEDISVWYSKKYNIPKNESTRLIQEVVETIHATNNPIPDSAKPPEVHTFKKPQIFFSSKNYRINGRHFTFYYESELLESLIHENFFPFEIQSGIQPSIYSFFIQNEKLVIFSGEKPLGCWGKNEFSEAKGKLYLSLLNLIYQKEEKDWLAILHASSVSRAGQCLIFPGISGSGKSVLAAILAKHQFQIISDDFVPVSSNDYFAYSIPLPITVKPGAAEILSEFYQNLTAGFAEDNTTEIKLFHKDINQNFPSGYNVKAIIFVKYIKGHSFEIEVLPNDKAFELLLADSWISPLKENVKRLLDWASSVTCYKMSYSDYRPMVDYISNLTMVGHI